MAHDPRRGMLRLLAGRHRGLPRQRRRSRRGAPLRPRHRRRGLRARDRRRTAGRDRAALGEPRPVRRAAALPDRRRHRPRRVLGAGRRQRLPQAGGQAGRPRAGALRARRRLHRRAEAARLRPLRATDGTRLVAVGVRAGDRRGRGRPSRSRLRLPGGGRAHGPRRPRAQRDRRGAHRIVGRRCARGDRGVRRRTRLRRRARLRAAAAGRPHPARVPRHLPRPPPPGRGDAAGRHLLAAGGRAADLALGERIDVVAGTPARRPIPPAPRLPAPAQPAGRAPARRSPTPAASARAADTSSREAA